MVSPMRWERLSHIHTVGKSKSICNAGDIPRIRIFYIYIINMDPNGILMKLTDWKYPYKGADNMEEVYIPNTDGSIIICE